MAELINYSIKITKQETVIKTVQRYQRIADTGNEKGDGPVYGNVPTQEEVVVETPILSQVIEGGDKLDIKTVIKAINSI